MAGHGVARDVGGSGHRFVVRIPLWKDRSRHDVSLMGLGRERVAVCLRTGAAPQAVRRAALKSMMRDQRVPEA